VVVVVVDGGLIKTSTIRTDELRTNDEMRDTFKAQGIWRKRGGGRKHVEARKSQIGRSA